MRTRSILLTVAALALSATTVAAQSAPADRCFELRTYTVRAEGPGNAGRFEPFGGSGVRRLVPRFEGGYEPTSEPSHQPSHLSTLEPFEPLSLHAHVG